VYSVTQKLIFERRHWSPKLVKFVDVKRIPIGLANDCLANANLAGLRDVLSSGTRENRVVAGWIVHRPEQGTVRGEAFQHWWNYDVRKKIYFDTTPLHPRVEEAGVEYVLDAEILHYATKKLEELAHTVGGDLTYEDGDWLCEKEINGNRLIRRVDNLKIENLMHFKKNVPLA
jgi:hypothetical protein